MPLAQTLKFGLEKSKCNIASPISEGLRVIMFWEVVEISGLIMVGCLLFLIMVISVCLYMLLGFGKESVLVGRSYLYCVNFMD